MREDDCLMVYVVPYVLLGYLSGSVLYARVFGELLGKGDITENTPDENPGAYNAFHNGGFWCGLLTLCCDVLKGALPVMLYCRLAPNYPTIGLSLVMAAPVAGHAFSVFHRFRGGKGIAVSFGCLVGLAPDLRAFLILVVLFILFSTLIKITPNYHRTLVTYGTAIPAVVMLVRVKPIRVGFLLIAGTVIMKLLASKEEREALEVKFGWKS